MRSSVEERGVKDRRSPRWQPFTPHPPVPGSFLPVAMATMHLICVGDLEGRAMTSAQEEPGVLTRCSAWLKRW